jgi:hypothetical protein
MKRELDCTFNIIGVDLAENGDYIGMITDNGFTLRFQDTKGNSIPLNKENVDKFLKDKIAYEQT